MKLWIANSEEWVVCEDYPSYMINREGQVKSKLTNKILKTARLKTGYVCVGLRKGGKSYTVRLHRLLAKAFIPNPNNKPHVDHINGVRDDTDKYQWFTDGNIWEINNDDLPSRYMQLNGHKATVDELIEYFK